VLRTYQPAPPETSAPLPPSEAPQRWGDNSEQIGLLPGESGPGTPWLDAAGEEVTASGRARRPFPTKEEALANRRYDVKAVSDLLEQAMRVSPSSDGDAKLLRNSAEWIEAGLCKLVVLSPTHDSSQRKLAPNQRSYFDSRVPFPGGGADYETGSDEGIVVQRSDVVGAFDLGSETLELYAPGSRDPALLRATLIHEIQHDADDSGQTERWAEEAEEDPNAHDSAPSWTWNDYQSEFRSYWMEPAGGVAKLPAKDQSFEQVTVEAVDQGADRRTGSRDDVRAAVSTHFANARQAAIFRHLRPDARDDVFWDAPEGWIHPKAYLPHYYVFDPAFRRMVDSLDVSTGGNLLNSPRIELLAQAIEDMDWPAIEAAARALDTADKRFLSDPRRSEPFWGWTAGASAEDRARIETLIGVQAP
jgi:hypothetical protein